MSAEYVYFVMLCHSKKTDAYCLNYTWISVGLLYMYDILYIIYGLWVSIIIYMSLYLLDYK